MFITTAISYLNGNPHVGHMYEIVISDIVSRYLKIRNGTKQTVVFQTGTDEHGQKIADTAESLSLKPIELCDQKLIIFKQLYSSINVNYDKFIRTSSPAHHKTVQHVFHKLKEQGDIYLGKYEGWYSSREEKFITDTQAKIVNYLDEVTGKPLERIEEDTYWFKMSKYQDKLIEFYKQNPQYISDEQHMKYILDRLGEGLRDLSISRTSLTWGIDLGEGHVCYVWFDALLNYLSGINYFGLDTESPQEADVWNDVIHIIGKDIVWFHGVIWTAMLMALNINLPKQIVVHGFVTDKNGLKMSKSLGNVIDPFELLSEFPVDVLRFYLCRFNNIGSDLKCSKENIISFNNGELAANIGNLVNRIVNLLHKFCNSEIPKVNIGEEDSELMKLLNTNFLTKLDTLYNQYQTRDVSQLILDLFHELNLWLTEKEPWKINDNDELRTKILRVGVERLYQISHTLLPIMPTIAQQISTLIGHDYLDIEILGSKNNQFSLHNVKLEKIKLILFPKIEKI